MQRKDTSGTGPKRNAFGGQLVKHPVSCPHLTMFLSWGSARAVGLVRMPHKGDKVQVPKLSGRNRLLRRVSPVGFVTSKPPMSEHTHQRLKIECLPQGCNVCVCV